MDNIKEIKCTITGKVQMVLFRDFTQRKSRGLSLVGEVENMRDMSVRVVAQGLEKDLNKFIELINKGPFSARVLRVDVEWGEPTEKFTDFNIIY